MESVSDAKLKNMTQEERVTALGMRTEALSGNRFTSSLILTRRSASHTHGLQMWTTISGPSLIPII